MIDDLRGIAIFQSVAEHGSFRGAATALGLSPSVISHHISTLESRLGTALLYRSTRRISLTEAGADLLSAAQRMTAAAEDGLAAIRTRSTKPTGTLRITGATPLAQQPFVEIISSFAQAHPEVHLDLHISDERLALEGSPYDLAIRGQVRDLDDSSYKARRLTPLPRCIFAAPDYVRARSPVRRFEDLADWDWIQSPVIPWRRHAEAAGATRFDRNPRIALTSNNHAIARRCVEQGLGFMIEGYPLVADDIAAGRLERILPDLPLKPIVLHAIYPANSPRRGLAHLFIEHFRAACGADPRFAVA